MVPEVQSPNRGVVRVRRGCVRRAQTKSVEGGRNGRIGALSCRRWDAVVPPGWCAAILSHPVRRGRHSGRSARYPKSGKIGVGHVMKYRGLVVGSLVLSLGAVETIPRKEPFDNPHVHHDNEVSFEIVETVGMAASGTTATFSAATYLDELGAKRTLKFSLRKLPEGA